MANRRVKLRTLVCGVLLLGGCARLQSCSSSLFGDASIATIQERWNSDDPKEDLITFKNGTVWENLGMKAVKIAEIEGPGESTAIAFQALSCVECEPDLLLTVRSTAGEKVVSEPFPGKMTALDIETGVRSSAPFGEVHAYYGKCLDGDPTSVFVVESISLPEGKSVIKIITPSLRGLDSARVEKVPNAVRTGGGPAGACREIPGKERDVEG
jgi:hypothetical protein